MRVRGPKTKKMREEGLFSGSQWLREGSRGSGMLSKTEIGVTYTVRSCEQMSI